MKDRKQSSTSHPITFLMVLSSDHETGATGLTPTVALSKDGGAFAAASGAVSEIGNGWYALAGNATDRGTLGELAIHATAATADPTDDKYCIVPWDPFDGNLALTGLGGLTAPTAGALPTVGTGAGQISVDGNGNVKSLLQGILSTLLTETTTGWLAAAFKKFFNLATPTSTMNEITLVDTTTNLTNAGPDTAGTTTLLSRLTSARAGYLDNLNVGGLVSTQAEFNALNLSCTKHLTLVTVGQYEPGETYTIEMRTFAAADGSAVNADTTPTLTATGQVSGSLSSNLSAATNPATGVYRWTYTPGASPTLEQIRFDGSATISSATFTLSCYAQTVDEATVVWTATDQSHLTAVYNRLPANNIADETLLLAAIGSPLQASNYTAPPTAAQNATAVWTDTTAGDFATAGSPGYLLLAANTVETGLSLVQAVRGLVAGIFGKLTSAGSNPEVFQNPAGTANRLTVNNDNSGNRTTVTTNL